MTWLRVFPAFNQILDAVSDSGTYEILMYACFGLTLVSCVYWTAKIGANGVGLYRTRPIPFMALGFGVAALFVYLLLFTDLNRQAGAGATGLFYMTSSPLVFALVYCIFFPLVVGGALGVGIKSLVALLGGSEP